MTDDVKGDAANDDDDVKGDAFGDDLLVGVKSIARFLRRPEREIYGLIARGQLEGTFRWGERGHAALKSSLRESIRARAKRA